MNELSELEIIMKRKPFVIAIYVVIQHISEKRKRKKKREKNEKTKKNEIEERK